MVAKLSVEYNSLLLSIDAPDNATIYSDKSGQVIVNGEQVIVKCSAVSNPASMYTIYRNQTIVLNTSLTGEYVISSFSEIDAGNYSCAAGNQVGSVVAGGVLFTFDPNKVIRMSINLIIMYSMCSSQYL